MSDGPAGAPATLAEVPLKASCEGGGGVGGSVGGGVGAGKQAGQLSGVAETGESPADASRGARPGLQCALPPVAVYPAGRARTRLDTTSTAMIA